MVTEFANQRCSDHERDVEQRVKQHDVLDGETNGLRTQQQEAEAELGPRKHSGWDKVAFEFRAEGFPWFEHALALVLNPWLILDETQDHDAEQGGNECDPEQDPERRGPIPEPPKQTVRDKRAENGSGLIKRLVHTERVPPVCFIGDCRKPGIARRPPETLSQPLDDTKDTKSND